MGKPIEDILSGHEPEQEIEAEPVQELGAEPEQEAEAEQEETEAQPRDDKGRFAAKAEEQKEPEQEAAQQEQPKEQSNDWTYAAYKDKSEQAKQWRDKATALEQEIAQYRQREAESQQRQQAPDMFESPDAYNEYWANRQSQFEQRLRFETSMQLAHGQHGEVFESAYQEAVDRANRGDKSIAFLMQSPNPGQALVAWYRREQSNQKLEEFGGDLDAYEKSMRERIEAEIREKYEAEQAAQQVQKPKLEMPTGLAGVRSVGPRTGPAWGGPKPITDILPQ